MQWGAIEVWTARPATVGAAACEELAALLDEHERERMALLRFEADRDAFVVAHALRRLALASALGTDPGALRFDTGAHGRPLLRGAGHDAPAFSLTRSRGLVACALGLGGEIGIDVEKVRPGLQASLLDPFMRQLPGQEPATDFFAQWTALEAFWKARGLGLSTAHPRIALVAVDGTSCHEVVAADTGEPLGMVVVRLPAPAGHVLTLACSEPADVRLIELERLAPPPAADAAELLARLRRQAADETAALGDANPCNR